MPREKENYRNMLQFLLEKGYPMTMSKTQAAELMEISKPHLDKIIRNKHIKVQDGKIPLGSIANYLCG